MVERPTCTDGMIRTVEQTGDAGGGYGRCIWDVPGGGTGGSVDETQSGGVKPQRLRLPKSRSFRQSTLPGAGSPDAYVYLNAFCHLARGASATNIASSESFWRSLQKGPFLKCAQALEFYQSETTGQLAASWLRHGLNPRVVPSSEPRG